MTPLSANFDFLGKEDAQLVRLGALAERYFKALTALHVHRSAPRSFLASDSDREALPDLRRPAERGAAALGI
jgi:hypothetical protein